MNVGISSARQTRAQHRHELRTLTYLTLDNANGGVVRNLTQDGMGAQVVVTVRPRQQLRIRFDLRYPRLRVEVGGEVVWATFSGQCGIRFVDLPPEITRKINEWIFGDLLEGISLHSDPAESMFAGPPAAGVAMENQSSIAEAEKDDGLMVSETPVKVIPLARQAESGSEAETPSPFFRALASRREREAPRPESRELDWLSQPLSGRSLVWAIHSLVVLAGLLLFALVFLSVTREAPQWPFAFMGGAALSVVALYWAFFQFMAGSTLGERLARLAECAQENVEEKGPRFR